jgi:predicted dehydrogenase
MLDNVELDVLSVTTPPQAHKRVALEAIRRGVSVFIEKPLVLKYSDAVEVIGEARSRSVKLDVTANYLFTPTMVKARELVKQSVIGDLKRVDVIVYAPEDVILSGGSGWVKNLPGGVFGEVLPHPIYLLQSLIGRLDLISVSSSKISRSTWQRWDELHVLLRGERGLGRIVISSNARHFDIYMIIEGRCQGIYPREPHRQDYRQARLYLEILKKHLQLQTLRNALARLHPRESAKRPLHRKHKDVQKPRRKGFSVFIQLR